VYSDGITKETVGHNCQGLHALTVLFTLMIHAGAAVGPLLAGVVSSVGWQYVFYMLMTANVLALLVRHHSILLPFTLHALNHTGDGLPELEFTVTILLLGH
jgi:MFS family permease